MWTLKNTMLTLSGSTIINLTLLTIFIEFGLPYPHEDLHTRHKTLAVCALDPSFSSIYIQNTSGYQLIGIDRSLHFYHGFEWLSKCALVLWNFYSIAAVIKCVFWRGTLQAGLSYFRKRKLYFMARVDFVVLYDTCQQKQIIKWLRNLS